MELKILRILIILLIQYSSTYCQSALGDANDKTSLILQNGGAISVNISENSTKVNYLVRKTSHPLRFGVELTGKATNGFASLFDGTNISPETNAKLSFGYQPQKYKTASSAINGDSSFIRDQWMTMQIGYRRGEYALVDQNDATIAQASNKFQNSPSFFIFYNALFRGNILAGISAGYIRQNNYQTLKKIDIIYRTTIKISDTTTQNSEQTISGRSGKYTEFDEYQSNVDILWVPGICANRLGVDLFLRYAYSDLNQNKFIPGIGLLVVKENEPSRIISGITAQWDNESHNAKFGFVTGFNF
jgi:hypothetical protein